MFIIPNIPEQNYFVDIKHVTLTADSPDLSVTELAYSMLKSVTPQMGITIQEIKLLRSSKTLNHVEVVNVSR